MSSLLIKFSTHEKILASSFFLFGDYYIVLGPLVSLFSKEELAWILAHELGHVEHSLHCCPYLDKNSPGKVCRDLLFVSLLLCYFYPLLLPVFCTFFYYIIYRWQKREYQADQFASLVMGRQIGIRTLHKLQSIDGCGFSLTHPSYRSRISNLAE
ncbi:Hypothetical protein BQ3484_403 [Cedratvirus A11]|uniref:Peptidase M48 domain-containing protein n=1 Tax=Cedratvirus A11 TaxID=1903266 RepID=A0A1M7XUX5_9VIRU|nr:Hypothetical protein BQ3484_403 [Cedratvirus A11]SHO33471.1 Hypothetical protein BQ3484_403 [Cedratvirus A11]